MHRLILAALPFLLCTAHATAQRIALGAKAGALMAHVDANDIGTSPVPGATVGLYLPYASGKHTEVQVELLGAYLGSGYQEPDGDEYIVRSLYLQVPVSVKYFFGKSFNLQGGLQVGWLLSAQKELAEEMVEVTDEYYSMDWGLNIGVGLDTRSGWDIALRYYHGMEEILVGDQVLFPRNRTVQFTVGYRFMNFRNINTVRRRK
jgi:hypothetical protein